MINPIPSSVLEPIVKLALAEDFGRAGDITTLATIAPEKIETWVMRSRQDGVIAGFDAAKLALELIDKDVDLEVLKGDGAKVTNGDVIAKLTGKARSLLMAERTMLNFIGRMSGIATLTNKYVELIKGTNAKVTDTRKTTPGLRALEKQAVKLGGGQNHRFGLDDAILIKDNHIAAAGGIENALKSAKAYIGHLVSIEVEVDTIEQLKKALPFYPNVIMLDNFKLDDLKEAIKIAREFAGERITLEASGGVNFETIKDIAQTGIDVISVGALTHSAPNFDIGLDSE